MTTGRAMEGERERAHRGTTYYASRAGFDDLAVVVKRFPRAKTSDYDRAFVLVHGIGVSSRYFHPVAAELAKTGQVYLIDLPGYGSAPNPKRDVTIGDHADVLGRFLERADLRNPVIVGHSMGTQVVSQLSVDFPRVSDRLVLMAPTVEPRDRRLVTQAAHLARDMTRESLRANLIVSTDYVVRCGLPYFLAQSKHLLGDHIEDRLGAIEARTLVLRGDADPIVSREWAMRVAELLPHGVFDEVVGPHVIMYSDPRRTAELIVRHALSR